MKSRKIFWVGKFIVFGIIFVLGFGGAVMLLWNWLVPALFAGPQITFLQAIGLLVLSKLLLGGFGRGWKGKHKMHHGGHQHWRMKFRNKWEQMSPEEREKMKEVWGGRCGHHAKTTEG